MIHYHFLHLHAMEIGIRSHPHFRDPYTTFFKTGCLNFIHLVCTYENICPHSRRSSYSPCRSVSGARHRLTLLLRIHIRLICLSLSARSRDGGAPTKQTQTAPLNTTDFLTDHVQDERAPSLSVQLFKGDPRAKKPCFKQCDIVLYKRARMQNILPIAICNSQTIEVSRLFHEVGAIQ